MSTRIRLRKFRIRRSAPLIDAGVAAAALAEAAPGAGGGVEPERLSARQLRMARRAAHKHGLSVETDIEAVRRLREMGVDPFARSNVLELVVPPRPASATPGDDSAQLPQVVPEPQTLPSTERASPADRRAGEIGRIQRDLARRRRRRLALLGLRLALFVLLPTLAVGWYQFRIATPMYATESQFVIQQAEPVGAGGGLGGMFRGTSMATQQDSITVQSYLTSRAALARLDADGGFARAFAAPEIDRLQRLPADASGEATYALYADHVRISYDPTEGIIKMVVVAPDPGLSQDWSERLIGYAEEQVDQLTQRLRADQMAGALASYEAAEARRAEALAAWLAIQQEVQQIDPVGETAARTQQISALETERQQLMLTLQERLAVPRPNQAQVDNLQTQIANIETLIADMRAQMVEAGTGQASLAAKNTELRLAEENYTFQTLLVQQALTQMETARIEANRQVRYLSLGVEPVAPDEPTYPRAAQNTALAALVFAGIYLMLSLTASILREQLSA